MILVAACKGADPASEAITLMKQGDFARAVGVLQPIMSAQPHSPASLYALLANAQAGSGNGASAIQTAQNGLRLYPQSSPLLKVLGELLFRRNPKDADAGEALATAAKGMPRDPEVLHFYAQWAYLNRHEEIAVEEEKKALAFVGSNDLARMQINLILGLAEDHMNHTELAETAFRRALACNRKLPAPDPMMTYQYLEFLDKNGRATETTPLAEEVLRYAPGFGPARLKYAKGLAREGNLLQAAEEGERALTTIGDDPEILREAHYFLAKTWLQLKQPDRAEPHKIWMADHPN